MGWPDGYEEIYIRQHHQVLLVHEVVAIHLAVVTSRIVGRQRLYCECREVSQVGTIQELPFAIAVDKDASRGLGRE